MRTSPTIRLLALVLAVMNVTFMAAFAVWVLYAQQRLGLSEQGFGILLTASALGGLVGSVVTGRLTDRFGPAALLRTGLLTETAVHVVLAVTRDPWVAGATMVAFGMHAAVWGAVVATIRQRLVPAHLLGRVTSVYQLLTMGGASMGALAGGWRPTLRPHRPVLGRGRSQRRLDRRGLAQDQPDDDGPASVRSAMTRWFASSTASRTGAKSSRVRTAK